MNNFYTRTLTGAGIVIFILFGFWLHPYTFLAAGFVLLAGCLYEYYRIVKIGGTAPQVLTGFIAAAYLYTTSSLVAAGIADYRLFLFLLALIPVLIVAEIFRKQQQPFTSLAHSVFPLFYIALPFSLFTFSAFGHSGLNTILHHSFAKFSPGLVIGFFILVWANDTGAYLTGVSIGRHKLLERISPKKTWEGLIGGLIFAAIAGWLLSGWLGYVSSTGWIIAGLLTGIAGTFGDLAESMLKRSTGIKDSGSILPGHGGFLDRFDSTIVAFPLVYLFITLFGRF